MKLTVKEFERKYLVHGKLQEYRGNLRTLRLAKESPYLWSLIEEDGKLFVKAGWVKNAIDYVSSPFSRKL